MRFTLSWLKDYLHTEASLDVITEKLTALGHVVDKIENKAEELSSFTICEILETQKHPNADRLKVCRVNTGEDILQIVCGGPNARAGLKTVLARPGTKIPSSQQVIKVGKVRDVESFGMLCSASELLLGDEDGGIIEVDPHAPVGTSYATWLGLDDTIINIEITPNRGDCLGVYGIARDLAAAGVGTLKPLQGMQVKGSYPCPLSVHLNPEACPHFTGRLIRGVKNGPSPEWLQRRLKAIGIRPISALVDITNFFAYDRARPLHVFDADKLKGELTIRLSKPGESFKALDGNTYTLGEDMAVIADKSGVVSLAGIMGGESTGCDETTQSVFLESAFFDPISIAITGRTLGILSDSRYRFERGVDPVSTLPGLEAATQMILQLCGGEASEVVVVGKAPDLATPISFQLSRAKALGGVDVPPVRVKEIFQALGFSIKGEGATQTILPPSWRSDIEQEADLIEEVLRVYGYDKISSVPFSAPSDRKPLDRLQERRFTAKDRLASKGLMEVVTWSFISDKDANLFGGVPESLVLLNPITQDLKVMRPSLLPNLLKATLSNQNRGAENIRLFEVGPQYAAPTPEGQHIMVTGLRANFFSSGNWLEKKRPVDIFDAKADALSVLELANVTPQVERTAPVWYHPGRSATLKLGPQVLGYFGEIHPHVLKAYDVKGPVVAFEIFLDHLPLPKRKNPARPKLILSPYQAVERDFAFIVDQDRPADDLLKATIKSEPNLIEGVTIFDVFHLSDNKKSVGIRVRFQPKERTLSEAEIQTISQKIITTVSQNTGGVLRQ